MHEQHVPRLSAAAVRQSLEDSLRLMTDDALSAFQIAVNDQALWHRAQDDPGEFLRERGLRVPDGVDVAFVDSPRSDHWPGRRCFRVCRQIGPPPPDPDPTVIIHCIEICLPWGGL